MKDYIFAHDTYERKPLYLRPPSWDCGWYWGFGYLGNKSSHYHVKSLMKEASFIQSTTGIIIALDGLPEYAKIWRSLSELFTQFYVLKEFAEYCSRGGHCHISSYPKIQDGEIMFRNFYWCNVTAIPNVFVEIYRQIGLMYNVPIELELPKIMFTEALYTDAVRYGLEPVIEPRIIPIPVPSTQTQSMKHDQTNNIVQIKFLREQIETIDESLAECNRKFDSMLRQRQRLSDELDKLISNSTNNDNKRNTSK